MVKDKGTVETITGKGKYFLHFNKFSVLEDPVNKNNFLVSMYVPVRELLFDRPSAKQILPIHPNCNTVDINESVASNIYKNVKQEFGEKGTFHIKSQGIKIACKDLEISETTNRVSFRISNLLHEGIIDGANLYQAINKLK